MWIDEAAQCVVQAVLVSAASSLASRHKRRNGLDSTVLVAVRGECKPQQQFVCDRPVTNGGHQVAMSNAEYLMSNDNLFSHASITMPRQIYLALILLAIVKKCQRLGVVASEDSALTNQQHPIWRRQWLL